MFVCLPFSTPECDYSGPLGGWRQRSGFFLNTIEMYNGLRQFKRDVTLLRYPNQEHGFTGAALKDFWTRENAFLDKYLNLSPRHRGI